MEAKETKLTEEIYGCKSIAANFFISGFDRARSQVELKAPDVDLSFLDGAKVVKDGEMVEDSDKEEEEGDEEVDQPQAEKEKEAEPPKDAANIVIGDEEEEDHPAV